MTACGRVTYPGLSMFEQFGNPWRRRRYELLDHLECLKSRRLRFSGFTVAGIAHGMPATHIDLASIANVRQAPLVGDTGWSAHGTRVYYDHRGHELALRDVVGNAIAADGLLELKAPVSLLLKDGEVRAIDIHHAALTHFRYIRSFVELLDQFGLPDTVVTRQANGAASEHRLLYRKARKQLVWSCTHTALTLVRLGNVDEHRPRTPPRGRKSRPTKSTLPLGIRAPAMVPPLGGWAPQTG